MSAPPAPTSVTTASAPVVEAETKRYVVEMNFQLSYEGDEEGSDDDEGEGKSKCISLYLDFGTEENYQIFEGDNFDDIDKYVNKHFPDGYFLDGEPPEPIRMVKPKYLTKTILNDLIVIPIDE
jgi:hypothetical protein